MILTASPATGRALVAIEPQLSRRWNYWTDPEFVAGTLVTPVGGAVVTSYATGGIGVRVAADVTGAGFTHTVTAGPEVIAGATVYVRVTIAVPAGLTVQVSASSEGGTSASKSVNNTTTSVSLPITLGPSKTVTVAATNPVPVSSSSYPTGLSFVVTAAGVLTHDVAPFSGSSPDSWAAVHRWQGRGYASTSEQSIPVTASMTVYRVVDGVATVVRGTRGILAGATTLSDNDVPLHRSVRYRVVLENGTTYESNAVVVQPQAPDLADRDSWPILSHPVTGRSARVVIASWETTEHGRSSRVVWVPGRRTPVVVSDVERAPSSSPTLMTRTAADEAALVDLLATGEPLLLRSPCPLVADAYLHVASRSTSRVTASSLVRLHALEVQEVDSPSMSVRGIGDTLGDIEDRCVTLGDIEDRYPTLGALDDADLIGGF